VIAKGATELVVCARGDGGRGGGLGVGAGLCLDLLLELIYFGAKVGFQHRLDFFSFLRTVECVRLLIVEDLPATKSTDCTRSISTQSELAGFFCKKKRRANGKQIVLAPVP